MSRFLVAAGVRTNAGRISPVQATGESEDAPPPGVQDEVLALVDRNTPADTLPRFLGAGDRMSWQIGRTWKKSINRECKCLSLKSMTGSVDSKVTHSQRPESSALE
jgi:hypothetical protein